MENSNVVQVGAQAHSIDLGGRHSIFDLQSPLVQNQHGPRGDDQQNWYELPARPGYLVDDVRKNHVLVVRLCTDSLPLNILSQTHVVSKKWVRNTKKIIKLQTDSLRGDFT